MPNLFTKAITGMLTLTCTYSFAENGDEIRLVPVDRSPESDNVELTLQFPKPQEIKNTLPIHIQIDVDGFPLGTNTDDDRNKEIKNYDVGQSLKLVIDDLDPIALNEVNAPQDFDDDHDPYYEQTVEYDFKGPLKEGVHTLRVFPAFSYGEALKGDHAFSASIFYYKTKTGDAPDLKAPFFTYAAPFGEFKKDQPILLDFCLSNCELSSDGYKMKLTIDGSIQRTIDHSKPHYIYGLSRGRHTIKLELLDQSNKLVSGPFTSVEKSISVD